MRRTLIVLAVLFSTNLGRAADKDWVGKQVMPRTSDFKLNRDGKVFETTYVMFDVVKEKDGWLLLKRNEEEGWALKTSWVLLEDAPAHYTKMLKADKEDTWALGSRATAWDNLGEHENAVKDYTEVIRLSPNVVAYYNRALSYRNLKKYELAIKDFTEAIRQKPEDSDYYYERGVVYSDMGEYDKAIKDYTEAIRLNQYARYYRERSSAYQDKGELEKAHKDINEAIRLEPNNADFLNLRGLIYLDQKDNDNALKAFTAAIKADSSFIYSFANRANIYRDKKEYEKAMADYDAALRIDPKYDFALRHRSAAWSNQKEYAKALKDADAAIKADPKNSDNYNCKAWYLATCSDADIRNGKQAVTLATKACELDDWKNPDHIDTLAAAYAESGDFESAVKYMKKALAAENLNTETAKIYKERLKLYEDKKPFHE